MTDIEVPNPVKVLLIDEDALMFEILEPLLRMANLKLTSASNLLDATAIIRKDPPAIIVMEIGLTAQDVQQFVEALRREVAYLGPIIATSNHQNPNVVQWARQSVFFNGYLPKPYDPDELVGYLQYKIAENKNPWSLTTRYANLRLDDDQAEVAP